MKNTRRFAAFVASVLAVACMAAPMASSLSASAEATKNTITITGADTTATHTYNVIKVFSGTATTSAFTGKAELTGLDWANTDTDKSAAFLAALQADLTIGRDFESCTTAAAVAEKLAAYDSNSDQAKAFADLVVAQKNNLVVSVSEGTAPLTVSEDGYYVIEEKALGNITNMGSVTKYLLGVYDADTGADITVKSSLPSFQKKIADINDTTDTAQGAWQDTADYDIGDDVPFQLKATLPSTYDTYKAYKLIFHDDLNKADGKDVFTLKEDSIVVYLDKNSNGSRDAGEEFTLNTDYTVKTTDTTTYSAADFDCDFEIVFTNLKGTTLKDDITNGSNIYVEYKATLNSDAVVGSAGNWNDAYLEYSNNPNQSDGGDTSVTPEDRVGAFTYKVVINKVDGANNKPLAGAEFTLSKKLEDGTTKNIAVVKSADGTSFTFSGLDDGTYTLSETQHPNGYNAISDIEFTVTATHTNDPETLELTDLNGAPSKTGEITFTADLSAGSLSATIANNSGSSLPSTGGMGTTLFYVGGGALVVGAGVLLVTKKRMANK